MHAAVGVVGSAVADGLELTTVHVFGAVWVSRSASATNASTVVGTKLSFVSMTVTGWYFSRSCCACVDAAADPGKAAAKHAEVAPSSASHRAKERMSSS
jgi:hypothetical protein